MQSKSKQPLKTWDLLGLFGLVALVVTLPGVIVHSQIQDSRLHTATHLVESLALRLSHNHETLDERSRLPSSAENTMGLDVWGHPFRYQYIRNARGQTTDVAVWSAGPNGVFETRPLKRGGRALVQFDGDDVGAVQPVRSSL